MLEETGGLSYRILSIRVVAVSSQGLVINLKSNTNNFLILKYCALRDVYAFNMGTVT